SRSDSCAPTNQKAASNPDEKPQGGAPNSLLEILQLKRSLTRIPSRGWRGVSAGDGFGFLPYGYRRKPRPNRVGIFCWSASPEFGSCELTEEVDVQYRRLAMTLFRRVDAAGKLGPWFMLALAVAFFPTAVRASTPLVFLSPVNDQITPAGFSIDPDYRQLFHPGASWQKAMSRVNAFEIVNHYVFTQDETILRSIFSFLHEHNIALAVVFGLVPSTNGCGRGVEGATAGQYNLGVAKRLKRLGADLKYIVVDEPLTFGHYSAAKD